MLHNFLFTNTDDKESFMKCYQEAYSALILLLITSSRSIGASNIFFECLGNEYKLETDLKGWSSHKDDQVSGWLLVSIRSPEEDQCIKKALDGVGYNPNNIWLGSKVASIGGWKWIDDDTLFSNVPYLNWAAGQPPTGSAPAPCALEYKDGKWSTKAGCNSGTDQKAIFKRFKPHSDWFIARTFLEVDLNQSPEVRMDYELGALAAVSDIDVRILAFNCESALSPSGVVSVDSLPAFGLRDASHDPTIGTTGTALKTQYLELNIDESKVSPGTTELEFCVRVEVKENSESVSFVETKVTLDLQLSANFNKDGIKVELNPEDHEQITSQFSVSAWKCDDSYNEDDSPLKPNDTLQLCIRADSAAVEIHKVQDLTFQQETGSQGTNYYSVVVIDNGNLANSDLTEVSYPSYPGSFGKIAMVRTQLESMFFADSNPNDIAAFGKVLLELSGRRRNLPAEMILKRSLQKDTYDASFLVNIPVDTAADDPGFNAVIGTEDAVPNNYWLAPSLVLLYVGALMAIVMA